MGAGAEGDVRDGVPGARNFRESPFLDQYLERNGEGDETVRRSGVGSAPIRGAAAQRSTLGIFAKQLGCSLCVGPWHPFLPLTVLLTSLPRQPLDRFDGMRGTSPPKELKLLVLECVRGKEELLQLLARTRWK